ncbi:MAG: phosphatase PAP2 family protein, partial [bacterium]
MSIRILAIVCLALRLSADAAERDYLDTAPAFLIPAGSIGCLALGSRVSDIDSSRAPLIRGPLPGEASIQRWLAGTTGPGRNNFLDDTLGSVLTPGICGVLLAGANAAWPRDQAARDIGQDLLLYLSGLAATKGVTELTKGVFARPRPLLSLYPELAATRAHSDWSYDHNSFFSGHASSSFFATTYLNLRLRDIMRHELHADEYRDWRWLPPTILYSWASFVCWSRLHAYKHYLSDVLVGATAGWLLAELFYHFAPESKTAGDNST